MSSAEILWREVLKPFTIVVMPGLVPGIHVFSCGTKNVDARDKPGHDDDL